MLEEIMDISMNSSLTKEQEQKKDIMYDLKSEYIYILIPFVILLFVKGYDQEWAQILLVPDWSLVSCIIFGQVSARLVKSVASCRLNVNHSRLGYYLSIRFLMVIVSAMFYFLMLTKPTVILGVGQILLFVVASVFFFRDGCAAQIAAGQRER